MLALQIIHRLANDRAESQLLRNGIGIVRQQHVFFLLLISRQVHFHILLGAVDPIPQEADSFVDVGVCHFVANIRHELHLVDYFDEVVGNCLYFLNRNNWLFVRKQRGRDNRVLCDGLVLILELEQLFCQLHSQIPKINTPILLKEVIQRDRVRVPDVNVAHLIPLPLVDLIEQLRKRRILELATHELGGQQACVK